MTSSLPSSSAWFLGLLAIMVTTTSMVAADSSDSSCTLNCPADAPCQLGEADFSSHEISLEHGSNHGMHCACPYGWTGILCDHRYETCDNSHRCYHGGECISGSTDNFGNDQLFCDCTKAVAADGTQYVGKYCETPFEKICDHTGEHFCVNSGDCNPNYPYVSTRKKRLSIVIKSLQKYLTFSFVICALLEPWMPTLVSVLMVLKAFIVNSKRELCPTVLQIVRTTGFASSEFTILPKWIG